MSDNQCAICLETNSYKTYKYCNDCNIYTHQHCFYYYINHKNILPECIICKKQCKLDRTNRLEIFKYTLSIFYTMYKINPLEFIKYCFIILFWCKYSSIFVLDTIADFSLYIIDEVYNTNGYFVLNLILYTICRYYINIINSTIIIFGYQSLVYNLWGDTIVKLNSIQILHRYYLYKYIIPKVFISSMMTYPFIISLYKLNNLYKRCYLISICNQYN